MIDQAQQLAALSLAKVEKAATLFESRDPGTSILGLALKKDCGLNWMLKLSAGMLRRRNISDLVPNH